MTQKPVHDGSGALRPGRDGGGGGVIPVLSGQRERLRGTPHAAGEHSDGAQRDSRERIAERYGNALVQQTGSYTQPAVRNRGLNPIAPRGRSDC